MYIDESGDCGTGNSPTRYFILSAIVIHELDWRGTLQRLVEFRQMLRDTKGLKVSDEIHCTHFINKPGELIRIKRNDRLDIMKKCMDWLNHQPHLNIYSVVADKSNKTGTDIFEMAWNALLMRFENTIHHKNFKGTYNAEERGMVLSDNTEGEKLRKLLRKMRHYNNIPNPIRYGGGYTNRKLEYIIEDPIFRDSSLSLMHQMNDVVAYCIRQKYEPSLHETKRRHPVL